MLFEALSYFQLHEFSIQIEILSKMNENEMPAFPGRLLMSPPLSNTNDIIDLTGSNDGDDSEVTSCSVIVSNNSVCSQQPGSRPIGHGSEIYSSTEAHPASADDSICILYERIIPKPEVEVINEVIPNNERNESTNVHSRPNSPVIMGACNEFIFPIIRPELSEITGTRICEPVSYSPRIPPNGFHLMGHHLLSPQIIQLNETSVARTGSSSEPLNYRVNIHIRESQPSTVSSSSLPTINESLYTPISLEAHTTLGVPRPSPPTTEEPLNLEVAPDVSSSNGFETQNSNVSPKIQCSICLDGPDEIAASNRNFTSTNCGHIFCNTCIRTALTNTAKCPKCRKRVTAKQIHPLYF